MGFNKWQVSRLMKIAGAGGICVALSVTGRNLATPAFASTELNLHVPSLDWDFKQAFRTYDHQSIRRGYQVYRQVCAACHNMKFICFRHLVGVCHTQDEMKAIAAEYQYRDGPDDNGEMFERPGKLTDKFPEPYPNENAARVANNGALPPDLSYIAKARHGLENYLFYLLTSFQDPPAGISVPPNQYYNPYFHGGILSMAPPLYNEVIEYEDGTPATTSQLAKDVTTFLSWAADPHRDSRERMLIKFLFINLGVIAFAYYWKRFVWSSIKSRKIIYKNRDLPKL